MPRMDQAALDLVAEAGARLDALDIDGARSVALASIDVEDLPPAHELLGGVHYLSEEYDEARDEWELAFDQFRRSGMDRDAARVALHLASMFASVLGKVAVGNGWIERARVQLDRVGPCVEWGYLELAVMACERPDVDDLLLSAERALALAIEHGDVDLEARALADGGLALVSQGRNREGFARLDAALAVISTGQVGGTASGICFCSMLSACDRSGDLGRAEEWTAMVGGVLGRTGDRPRVLRTHCNLAYGSVLFASGRWPEAEELMVGGARSGHQPLHCPPGADGRPPRDAARRPGTGRGGRRPPRSVRGSHHELCPAGASPPRARRARPGCRRPPPRPARARGRFAADEPADVVAGRGRVATW